MNIKKKKSSTLNSLIILLVFAANSLHAFSTLTKLKEYVLAYSEYPPSDNNNWLDPDYTTFHQSITTNPLLRWTHKIGLRKKITWNEVNFHTLLKEVVDHRETQKLTGDTVVHIHCKPNTKIYVWSDLHGALHSLIRCLTSLQKQNIIDDTLKITQADTYFVFNGDSINRSAYNLETLNVLLNLLEKNPDNVFYIRGKHETKSYWQNFGLKRELKIRMAHLSEEAIPLASWINRLFNTLPLAIYLSVDKKPSELIRISHVGRKNNIIDEEKMGNLFSTHIDSTITYHQLNNKKDRTSPIDIKVIIKTEDWMKEQRASNGLGLLDQDKGATAWAVLSSPTIAHRKYYNFFYDAFAVITVGSSVDTTPITLYRNNLKTEENFALYQTYNIVTAIAKGTPTYKQKRKKDFFIGSSMALELGVPIMGQRTKRGMSVAINQTNQTGGINGHQLRTIIHNDDYVPYLTRQNINGFIKKDINTILLPVGSPTLNSYLDYIRKQQIAVLFPITGGPQFRAPDLKGLIHWRATYNDEVQALINYLVTEYNTYKFAFFYQDDAYGQEPVKAAHETLKSLGITEWVDIPYTRAAIDFTKQAQIIEEKQPDAIGFFSTGQATQELIRQIGIPTLTNKQLFGISFLGEQPFRRFIKQHGLEVLFGAVVPNPYTSELEIVKNYRTAMDANNHPYDIFSLEAYITTNILADILKKIGKTPTKDNIIKYIETLKNYTFKGLTLTFDPQRRDLAQYVWIETGKNVQWIQQEINKKTIR